MSCEQKVFDPQRKVSIMFSLVHGTKHSGHFKFAKIVFIMRNFHWRHRTINVKIHADCCIVCQQYKDSNQKK